MQTQFLAFPNYAYLLAGDHVALIYPPGVDLIAAFYGCLYVGVVPVTIRPPHTLRIFRPPSPLSE